MLIASAARTRALRCDSVLLAVFASGGSTLDLTAPDPGGPRGIVAVQQVAAAKALNDPKLKDVAGWFIVLCILAKFYKDA